MSDTWSVLNGLSKNGMQHSSIAVIRHFWHATLSLRSDVRRHPLQRAVLKHKSAASGSIRWWCLRSYWMVLSHVMRGRPGCILQSAGGEANRILLASALLSMRAMCQNRVSRHD